MLLPIRLLFRVDHGLDECPASANSTGLEWRPDLVLPLAVEWIGPHAFANATGRCA